MNCRRRIPDSRSARENKKYGKYDGKTAAINCFQS
jgi:hypothetical protein